MEKKSVSLQSTSCLVRQIRYSHGYTLEINIIVKYVFSEVLILVVSRVRTVNKGLELAGREEKISTGIFDLLRTVTLTSVNNISNNLHEDLRKMFHREMDKTSY